MGLKRREFLEKAGLLLATLGIQDRFYFRSYQALAQSTPRKLALLVGINQYPIVNRVIEPLQGCLTDVELQRELLINRFGFNPRDIVTLTNEQATRANIQQAFASHLRDQAKANDVVVFHFSGYGSCVPVANPTENRPPAQHSLLPVDAELGEDEKINDIFEETLGLLLRSLPTSEVITILDTSYLYPGHHQQGTLKIRASNSPTVQELNPKEIEFQDQLLTQLGLSRPDLEHHQLGQLPGLILAATKPNQIATEGKWDGFIAGLFTYLLTQSFWGATPPTAVQMNLSRVAGEVEQVVGSSQQPQLRQTLPGGTVKGKVDKTLSSLMLNLPPSDGVITAIEDNGKTAKILLTGIPVSVLESYSPNSILTVPTTLNSLENPIFLQLRSRTGLTAKVTIKTSDFSPIPSLEIGQQVQERIRILPRQISLKVALDPKLARIERVDATSAFSGISRMSVVASDQAADYLLSRVQDTTLAQTLNAPFSPMAQSRYGLFSLGQALLPNTVGEGGEAVKVAVHRLVPQLRTRLAVKVLRLTENERSAQLKVRATLTLLAPQSQILIKRETYGMLNSKGEEVKPPVSTASVISETSTQAKHSNAVNPVISASETTGIVRVPVGSRLQYKLQNQGDSPVYFIVLSLDSRGQASIVVPGFEQHQQQVAAGKTLSLPPATVYSGNPSTEVIGEMVIGPAGLSETHIIFSHAPFTQTLAVLDKKLNREQKALNFHVISNPLEIAEAILQDLSKASQPILDEIGMTTDDLALDINAWAGLNFIYRVVG